MRRAAFVGCIAIVAIVVTVLATAKLPPPSALALIGSWAASSPISGHRCSGVLLDELHIATARHCLSGGDLSVVLGGTLCAPQQAALPRVLADGAASPGAPDLAVVGLERPLPATAVRIGPPRRAQALVVGYGDNPNTGRLDCLQRTFRGTLDRCSGFDAGSWCLTAPAEEQSCGGSSGAPVYLAEGDDATLVGVVSAGPPCGDEGPILVATFAME